MANWKWAETEIMAGRPVRRAQWFKRWPELDPRIQDGNRADVDSTGRPYAINACDIAAKDWESWPIPGDNGIIDERLGEPIAPVYLDAPDRPGVWACFSDVGKWYCRRLRSLDDYNSARWTHWLYIGPMPTEPPPGERAEGWYWGRLPGRDWRPVKLADERCYWGSMVVSPADLEWGPRIEPPGVNDE
jgi:hypothetical protein